jgi:hypothetical protein
MRKAQVRIVIFAAICAAALCSIAASSASALVEFSLTNSACSGGTTVAICYVGTNPKGEHGSWEFKGQQSETVTGGAITLLIKSEPEQIIECASSNGSGTITQNSPLPSGLTTIAGKLFYGGCKLITEPSKKCVVQTTNETRELLGELESETEIKLMPETGTTFLTIVYSNISEVTLCPVIFLGEHAVTGTQSVRIIEPGFPSLAKSGEAFGETLELFSDKAHLSQRLTLTFSPLSEEDLPYVSKVA